jgi:hypothetical protein
MRAGPEKRLSTRPLSIDCLHNMLWYRIFIRGLFYSHALPSTYSAAANPLNNPSKYSSRWSSIHVAVS